MTSPEKTAGADFAALALSPPMLANLQQLGYTTMTPIQAASLPPALLGKDLIAQASTGSGKTAAFALALLANLNPRRFAVQALVLCNPGGIFERNLVTRVASPVFATVFAQGEKQARWYKPFYSAFYHMVLTNAPAKTRRSEIIEQAYETAQVCREAWQSFGTPESDLRDKVRERISRIFA